LTIQLQTDEITDASIDELENVLTRYPGKTKLQIKFIDPLEGLIVGVNATQKNIELNSELFKDLEAMHIHFDLN
jgi:hypothetical protein